MATGGSVLGVIRASRPNLLTAIERVAFAIHAAFLATGYSLVAVGVAANTHVNDDGTEEPEVGFEGWNTLEGAYAFRYIGAGQADLCKSVILKIVVMVESLMVEVAQPGTEILHHLEIKASDFAMNGAQAGNYAQQFINLDALIKQINDTLLSKLSPLRTTTSSAHPTSSSTSLVQQNERISDTRRASAPPLLYDTRRSFGNPGVCCCQSEWLAKDLEPEDIYQQKFSTFIFPPVFIESNNDLYPRPGGGIFAPRRNFGSDGMLIGPNDPQWQHSNGGLQRQSLDFEELIAPPNARYDPIGPPNIPGIDIIDYDRSTTRPPGRHPDLEHF